MFSTAFMMIPLAMILKQHLDAQTEKKIPGELFFNLQGFMWVEFHSKAHGIWWMS